MCRGIGEIIEIKIGYDGIVSRFKKIAANEVDREQMFTASRNRSGREQRRRQADRQPEQDLEHRPVPAEHQIEVLGLRRPRYARCLQRAHDRRRHQTFYVAQSDEEARQEKYKAAAASVDAHVEAGENDNNRSNSKPTRTPSASSITLPRPECRQDRGQPGEWRRT